MSNIDNMLASIITKDKEGFASSFSNEMKERLASSIIDKNLNTSNSIISSNSDETDNDTETEVEEAVNRPKTYTFKSPKDAKDFMISLSHMGIKKTNVSHKGKSVTIKVLRKDTLQMIQNIAKDLKASIKEESDIILALKEASKSEFGLKYTLKDLNDIHILPKEATSITKIHDTLSKDNQFKMRDMVSENKDSFNKVLNFCNNKLNIDEE